jgi:pimeloyl-ACP methyl ester carboxylesterase
MVYVRRHSERVRTVALQGVVPIDAPMWLEAARSSQQALDETFAACARQPACRAAVRDPATDLAKVLQRLAEKPAVVEGVTIDDVVVRHFIFRALYSASRARELPLLVHLAAEGDLAPLGARVAVRGDSGVPKGVYLSIVCNEVIPLFDPDALPAAASGTFLGTLKVGREIRACREWPRAALPPDFWTPVRSSAPALVMNGALDSLTPPRYGEHVAWSLVNARHLVLPGRAHDDVDPCVTGVIEAFVLAGHANGLDTSCLARTPDLPFAVARDELLRDP